MAMLKWLLPDEWILKLFPPSDDNEDGIDIYLYFVNRDISLKFTKDTSRYDVIEFIKQIHDDYDTISDNMYDLTNQYLEVPEHISTQKIMSVFQTENIVFMNNTTISIEHDKNEEGKWLTKIYKEKKNSEPVHLATISNYPEVNNNVFTEEDIEHIV